jgi:hypothetical protein
MKNCVNIDNTVSEIDVNIDNCTSEISVTVDTKIPDNDVIIDNGIISINALVTLITRVLSSTSIKLEEVYTNLYTNSSIYLNLDQLEDLTILKSLTSFWDSNYTTVNSNSAIWNYQGTDIKTLTSFWDSVYLTTNTLSSNWQYAYTYLNSITGTNPIDNKNVITFVQNNSSNIIDVNSLVVYSSGGWQNAAIFVERGIIDCGFF